MAELTELAGLFLRVCAVLGRFGYVLRRSGYRFDDVLPMALLIPLRLRAKCTPWGYGGVGADRGIDRADLRQVDRADLRHCNGAAIWLEMFHAEIVRQERIIICKKKRERKKRAQGPARASVEQLIFSGESCFTADACAAQVPPRAAFHSQARACRSRFRIGARPAAQTSPNLK